MSQTTGISFLSYKLKLNHFVFPTASLFINFKILKIILSCHVALARF